MHKRRLVAGIAAAATVGGLGFASLAAASTPSAPKVTQARTLHLVSPIKGRITTPTSDLSVFRGPVTNRTGHKVGHLQGYCATVDDATGRAECTTTLFLSGSQIELVGPTFNRSVHSRFQQSVAGGTGTFRNAQGQATLTLRKTQAVAYTVHVIP